MATYYRSKSVRIGNRTTSKAIEKIGTYEEIKEKCSDMDPLDCVKQYVAKSTREKKSAQQDVIIKYFSSTLVDRSSRRSVNVWYLFLQDIYYSLGLGKICAEAAEKHRF